MVGMKEISASEGRSRFGQLLEAARRTPVRITKHGIPIVVMLPRQHFDQLRTSTWERLTSTMDAMGKEASANGLTDAKLEAILAEES